MLRGGACYGACTSPSTSGSQTTFMYVHVHCATHMFCTLYRYLPRIPHKIVLLGCGGSCMCTRDMMEYQLLVDCRIPLWNGKGLYGTSHHALDTLIPYSRTCTMDRHGTVWYIPPCTGHCLSMYPGTGYTSHRVPETGVANPLSRTHRLLTVNSPTEISSSFPCPPPSPDISLPSERLQSGKEKRVYTCTLLDTTHANKAPAYLPTLHASQKISPGHAQSLHKDTRNA